MCAIVVGSILVVIVLCPMIYFIVQDGVRYGTEVEGGSGGTHDPMTRRPKCER